MVKTPLNTISRMGYPTCWIRSVPKGECLALIREAHTSKVVGNFGVGKTVANVQRYVYCPKMQEQLSRFIRGCMFCCTSKPSNRKQVLYHHSHVPTHPWESISMDFVGGLLTIKKGHDYLFMVVDKFNNMCVLIPCKKDHQWTRSNRLILWTSLGTLWDTKEHHFR